MSYPLARVHSFVWQSAIWFYHTGVSQSEQRLLILIVVLIPALAFIARRVAVPVVSVSYLSYPLGEFVQARVQLVRSVIIPGRRPSVVYPGKAGLLLASRHAERTIIIPELRVAQPLPQFVDTIIPAFAGRSEPGPCGLIVIPASFHTRHRSHN